MTSETSERSSLTTPEIESAQIPEGVERLVLKLLEKDPAKRLPSAHKVIEIITAMEQKRAEAKPSKKPAPSPQPFHEPEVSDLRFEGRGASGTTGLKPAAHGTSRPEERGSKSGGAPVAAKTQSAAPTPLLSPSPRGPGFAHQKP